MNVKEKHHLVAARMPRLGACAPGQAIEPSALGMCPDQELNLQPFGHGMKLQQLSHTGQGSMLIFKKYLYIELLANEEWKNIY